MCSSFILGCDLLISANKRLKLVFDLVHFKVPITGLVYCWCLLVSISFFGDFMFLAWVLLIIIPWKSATSFSPLNSIYGKVIHHHKPVMVLLILMSRRFSFINVLAMLLLRFPFEDCISFS